MAPMKKILSLMTAALFSACTVVSPTGNCVDGDAAVAKDSGQLAVNDSGISDAGISVKDAAPVVQQSPWLTTSGNKILLNGMPFKGRGVNVHDTRSCWACAGSQPNAAEVKRRIDEVASWGANFIRLDLENYAKESWMVSYASVVEDPAYLAAVVDIVKHAASKPGMYVMISIWHSTTLTAAGLPTLKTNEELKVIAKATRSIPNVLYGVSNEPQSNYDGKQDAAVWAAMNSAVDAIRSVETAPPYHIVAVQGTRGWGRDLSYYMTHPITAGGGVNVAYETHVYDPQANFAKLFVDPSKKLPVIIGEYGPTTNMTPAMTLADTAALQAQAEALQIPYLAWTLHGRCPPNILKDNSGGGCGIGMKLETTAWGQQVKDRLAKQY